MTDTQTPGTQVPGVAPLVRWIAGLTSLPDRRRVARRIRRKIDRVVALIGRAADPGPHPCIGSDRTVSGKWPSEVCDVCHRLVPVVPDPAGWGGAVIAVHHIPEVLDAIHAAEAVTP